MSTTVAERIHADHATLKRLGHWTRSGLFDVRARKAAVVLDLRSPHMPDDIEIHLDLHRTMVKLLLPEDAPVDHWELTFTGKGRIKDGAGQNVNGTRRVRLTGTATDSEIRIHRGGVAILSAMCSREYLDDLRAAHREGRLPAIDDPTRGAAPSRLPRSPREARRQARQRARSGQGVNSRASLTTCHLSCRCSQPIPVAAPARQIGPGLSRRPQHAVLEWRP
jgi:hypothetical protein